MGRPIRYLIDDNCPKCGKTRKMFKHERGKLCLSCSHTGSRASRWNGGKTITTMGYILVMDKTHPNKDRNGHVPLHRLVMEKHIGRRLEEKERVHHVDKNKQNNKITNLMLFPNNATHTKHHHILRARNNSQLV